MMMMMRVGQNNNNNNSEQRRHHRKKKNLWILLLIILCLIEFCFIQYLLLLRGEEDEETNTTTTNNQQQQHQQHVDVDADDLTTATIPFLSSPCIRNPYLNALEEPIYPNITRKINQWFHRYNKMGTKSLQSNMFDHDHKRFFPFNVFVPCKDKSCIGGKCRSDTSKVICGLSQLNNKDNNNNNKLSSPVSEEEDDNNNSNNKCIIYSIGSNNQWKFELDLLNRTPKNCEIHTFDCTGPIERYDQIPKNPRLHFHHICITSYPQQQQQQQNEEEGDSVSVAAKTTTTTTTTTDGRITSDMVGESWTLLEMQQKLNHTRIDLLKIDIEGFEFPILNSWPELVYTKQSSQILLPMQILLEVHYQTQFTMLHPDLGDFKTATDILEFQRHLMNMGYVVVNRDNNRNCLHCSELTLIRVFCPRTGVYTNI